MRSNISRVLQQGLTAALRENLPRTAVQLSASIDASATVLLERTRAPGFTFRSKELISLRTFASAAHPAEKQAPETSPSVQQSVPRPARQPRRQAPSPAPSQLQRAATDTSRTLRVEATYVGSRINVYDLLARPEFSSHYKRLHKGTAILALTDTTVPESAEADGMPLGPYLVATSYGSAVFFDVDAAAKEQWLSVLRSVAVDPVVGDKSYNEEYSVMVAPELTSWSQLEPECIRLQTLDLRNMQVVAQALAQSVALDYYSSHVERTLETFCSMNLEMAETANTKRINKQELLQLVAENNIVMTEIISKLGVHERFDIAWKYAQYGRIWEYLRSELEMEPRFKILDMKLNLIQDNLKYFLEILQARKSDALEWTIIILIGVEICLSLYELGSMVT